MITIRAKFIKVVLSLNFVVLTATNVYFARKPLLAERIFIFTPKYKIIKLEMVFYYTQEIS